MTSRCWVLGFLIAYECVLICFGQQSLLDDLLNRTHSHVRPHSGGPPTPVAIGIFINHFSSVSEVNMDYQLDIILRETWKDDRLQFTGRKKPLTVYSSVLDKVWKPDLYFVNELKSSIHTVSVPNKLVRISPDGRVLYTFRATVTAACNMHLSNYPMDRQICDLEIMSYSYLTDSLLLHWFKADAVQFGKGLSIPQFTMERFELFGCTREYLTGIYPCVGVRFYLTREYRYFLLQVYLPSALICVLSWVAFWIHKEAVPARVTLGVTTVLTMTAQFSGVQGRTPRVSYAKALDVWMATLMVFVFAALLEYAFVNVCERYARDNKDKDKGNHKHRIVTEKGKAIFGFIFCHPLDGADAVDKVSRWLFPIAFIIFNVIYWVVYTAQRDQNQ